jgi:adenosine deaminase
MIWKAVYHEEKMKNTLVMSLGGTWHLVAEVLGLLNPEQYPLYEMHDNRRNIYEAAKRYGIENVSEIVMICTLGSYNRCKDEIESFMSQHAPDIKLCFHYIEDMEDIVTEADARSMKNLIYKTIYAAANDTDINKLYLCLSGGRKTMSSDFQQAAYLFGCQAMIHILADGYVDFDLSQKAQDISVSLINKINPVIYSGEIAPDYLSLLLEHNIGTQRHEVGRYNIHDKKDTQVLDEVERLQKNQKNLVQNYSKSLINREASTQFRALMMLSPKVLATLKNRHINEEDLDWLYKLPKADLHCHLGGIADVKGLYRIAKANQRYFVQDAQAKKTLKKTKQILMQKDESNLQEFANQILAMEKNKRWLNMSAFLSCFEDDNELLERLVYGKYLKSENYRGVGLDVYEKIGDYQGSSLLQSEEAIREAAKLLKEDALHNNLIYKEVRCSPANYNCHLNAREVVEILWDELKDARCLFRLIIIGSRHRDLNVLRKHINLCLELKSESGELSDFICGFDLAGPEDALSPRELRKEILPLLEACVRITIHAGETSNVDDIWTAVYELNADRIGHGLSLGDHPKLLRKFRDHRTAVELCPSSNHQISGFWMPKDIDEPIDRRYPLKHYLQEGIKACICTDDPGISRTDISREYLMASKLCNYQLSKWDTLSLIRNGFVNAFLPHPDKQKLILEAEKQIVDLL